MQRVFDMFSRFLEKGNCQIIPMSSLLPMCCANLNLERMNDIQIIDLVLGSIKKEAP
jgi:hypothetical protein